MGKVMEVQLTAEEAQFLLERASQTVLPNELGEEKFTVADQSIANDELASLVMALRGYSPWFQGWGRERLILFGDKSDWKIDRDEKGDVKGYEHLEPGKIYKVRLPEDDKNNAVSGAMWVLFISLYPTVRQGDKLIHRPVPAMTAAQICWPVAKKLGKVGALRAFLKLDKSRSRVWADDQEKEEEAKAAS